MAHLFLLVGAGEIESGHIGPGIDLPVAELRSFLPVGNDLPDRLLRVEGIAALVHIGQLHGLADPDGAGIRCSPGR